MPYNLTRATYESELARAHRSLWKAGTLAGDMNDLGAQHDCEQLTREVTRLAQDSLRPRPYRPRQIAGQLDLVSELERN